MSDPPSLCLSLSDGMYFNDAWISRIKPEVGDNWRLKVFVCSQSHLCSHVLPIFHFVCVLFFQISNLKKILKGILDYNHEVRRTRLCDTDT